MFCFCWEALYSVSNFFLCLPPAEAKEEEGPAPTTELCDVAAGRGNGKATELTIVVAEISWGSGETAEVMTCVGERG